MSLGLNKTKRRIASVKSTQKITKAMGMIASVKLKRCKDRFDASELYRDRVRELISKCFYYAKNPSKRFTQAKEGAKGTLFIVITSNLGLCAGYNSNLLKYARTLIDPNNDDLLLVGEKGKHHFGRDEAFQESIVNLGDIGLGASYRECFKFAFELMRIWEKSRYEKIELIYTHYVNSLRFEPASARLLPISPEVELPDYEAYCPPIIEPKAEQVLNRLLPYYLAGSFYNYLSESELSEQSARRMAMDNANDNADELLDKLTIEYNKARQTAITQEIVEVVSGSSNA